MPTRRPRTWAPSRRWLRRSTLASPTGAGRLIRAIRDCRSAAVAAALIVSAALSLFLSACDHQPKIAVRGAGADALRALAARADRLAGEDEFSGAVLVAKDGRVLFSHAYGPADRTRRIQNTLRTRFRIGSMNKMFTAVAILQLVEAGKIKLTAPLGTYLPDYPNREVATKVTIHQLLTRTGGTGNILFPDFLAHRKQLRTHADYVKLYGKRGLEFEPGSGWAYSSYGFLLLGVVIEKVTGQSYYDYVQQHVYAPAGMTRSGSLPEHQAVADRSIGYTKPPGTTAWVPNTDTLPYRGTSAGGGYSTVEDLARFAHALLSHKLLRPDATELLITGKAEASLTPGARYSYGFEDARDADGNGWVGHGGVAPGMNGDLRIYPKTGYVVAVLANIDPPAARRISEYLDPRLPIAPYRPWGPNRHPGAAAGRSLGSAGLRWPRRWRGRPVENPARVAAREKDRKPRRDDGEERADVEQEQHDVVWDREEPLDDRQPAVEVSPRVGVAEVQTYRLLLVGRGVAVVHQRHVDPHPVGEAQQLEVPVKPPARVLLAEHDHQQRRQEHQPRAADRDRGAGAAGAALEAATAGVAADARQHDCDRDDREDPEGRRKTVQLAVRVVDRKPHGMVVVHAFVPLTRSGRMPTRGSRGEPG
jgi:D-alanyl-D-alanine carboxypeptidase